MNLQQLTKKKEKLEEELAKIDSKIRQYTRVGYRAILPGDEYNYGFKQDYYFNASSAKKHREYTIVYTAKEAKALAEAAVKKHGHGYVEEIFKGDERNDKKVH